MEARAILTTRRTRLWTAVTAASVAVAGAGTAFAVHAVTEARLNEYEVEAFADAKRLATLDLDLVAAAERADKVLADTEGKVKDNAVREALADQIAKARELTKDTADHTPTRPEFSSDEQAEATIDAQDLQIGKLLATSGRVTSPVVV